MDYFLIKINLALFINKNRLTQQQQQQKLYVKIINSCLRAYYVRASASYALPRQRATKEIFDVAWTLIPKSTTPVVPLCHFSRNAGSGWY